MPHIHDKIDFTVEVFVIYKNKVLLRKHDKYKIWLSVGGHIELDEDPNEAAVREVKEEVGLEVKIAGEPPSFKEDMEGYKELIPPRFLNRHSIDKNHEHVTMVYFATSETEEIKPSDEEKSEEWKWFTREELDDESYDFRENIRFYAKRALEELVTK